MNKKQIQKKVQKKKEREKNVRKKILLQREDGRKKLKEEKKLALENKSKTKLVPITRANLERAQKLRDEEIKLHLEHNMKILQALQDAEDEEKKISELTPMTGLTSE